MDITHYTQQLKTETDPAKLELLQKFLTEELAKQASLLLSKKA